jgi:hypothetical protein
MITHAMSVRRSEVAKWFFLAAGILILALDTMAAEPEAEGRVSMSTQASRLDRENGIPGVTTRDEFGTLKVDGDRSASKNDSTSAKAELRQAQSANVDFWFYAADVELFNDLDGDGYYHGVDLWFDADTYYESAEVYAVVYLSLDGGPWNEYAVTDDFILTGTASDDDYNIVTELVSGYPTGSYDILVELFDAWDSAFVAWIGPDETPELAFLPLEDADRDVIIEQPEVIVVHEHGGGASSVAFILFLAMLALAKHHRAMRCAVRPRAR